MPRLGKTYDFLAEYQLLNDRVRRLELRDLNTGRGADHGSFSYLPQNSWLGSGWAIDSSAQPEIVMDVWDAAGSGFATCHWSGNIYYTGSAGDPRKPFGDFSGMPSELQVFNQPAVVRTVLPKTYDDSQSQPSTTIEGLLLELKHNDSLIFRDPEDHSGSGPAYSLDLITYRCVGYPRDDPARWSGAAWSWDGPA